MRVTNHDILRVFLQHARRYTGRCVLTLAAVAVAVTIDVISPWYLRDFIDTLANPAPSPDAFAIAFRILVTLILLRLCREAAWRSNGFLNSDIQPRIMSDLEQTSFRYLLGHSYQFFTDTFAGSLVRKVHRISRAFDVVADEIQYQFLPAAILLIGATVSLALRHLWLAVAFVCWSVAFLAFNYLGTIWKLRVDIRRAEADSASSAALADALTNAVTIKLFTGIPHEATRFAETKDTWRKLQTQGWRRGEIIWTAQSVLIVGIEFGLLTLALRGWQAGILSVGDIVLIQSYLLIVIGRLWDIGRSIRHLFEAFADAREMVEILELPYAIRDRRGVSDLRVTRGAIAFRDVAFHFHRTRVVLDRFDLRIAPKEKLALVGPSGAGKSTVTKLLFRFYDVDDGTITIDGQDVARVTQDSLRSAIALVPQEPILFHRTLMENIRYGRRDASDAEVIAAAQQAHCHEFITASPQGYDTYVGERGIKLSGGERQRIAIARAILKNAPILVLDEATSSLDSESERLIQDALRVLMTATTAIVIAHRLSTIMLMDRIAVVEQGRVTATGTHTELLAKGGTYQRLWEIQAGGFLGGSGPIDRSR